MGHCNKKKRSDHTKNSVCTARDSREIKQKKGGTKNICYIYYIKDHPILSADPEFNCCRVDSPKFDLKINNFPA